MPILDDDRRDTSLILVHSVKGKQILQGTTSQKISQQIDEKATVVYNHTASHSVTEPAHRADFFKQLGIMPFSKFINQLLPITLKKRISILKCSMSRLKNKLARLK